MAYTGKVALVTGGASGMGKTRMALKISKNTNSSMYSDEKTILNLNKKLIQGGVNTAYLSKPFLKKMFDGDNYLKFNINKSTIPINFFVYPYVEEENTGKPIIEKWESDKFEWHLYEELSRKIRGTSRRFFNMSVPAQSLDTSLISKRRSDEIKHFTKEVPCYFMKGSEEQIEKAILELIN